MIFDFAVIGIGLIGAAAGKHLSQFSGNSVLIGPAEPKNADTHDGVFASHYDQGRITRRLSKDAVWSELAARSIDNYGQIERESGVQFHLPTGGVYVSAEPNTDSYLQQVDFIGRKRNIPYQLFNAQDFPYLRFPDGSAGIAEPPPAGVVNPRELIQAQLSIAQNHGATIVRDTVTGVTPSAQGFKISVQSGEKIFAKNVLVAAGAFSNSHALLPRKLAIKVKTETTIWAQLTEADVERLHNMPTVIYDVKSDVLDSIYMAPPLRYPNGNVYVKMGCNTAADQWLSSLDEMQAWMRLGNSDEMLEAMSAALLATLPSTKPVAIVSKRCLVTYSPHGRPMIGQVDDGLFVATAGNGSAAKSSDAIGQLAANLVANGVWQDELDADLFEVVYDD